MCFADGLANGGGVLFCGDGDVDVADGFLAAAERAAVLGVEHVGGAQEIGEFRRDGKGFAEADAAGGRWRGGRGFP